MRTRRLWIALGVALALGVGGLALASAWAARREVRLGLVDGRLAPCPATPNCVCSEDPSGAGFVAPLAFRGEPEAALHGLLAFLEREPGVEVLERRADYAHLLFRTRLLRFTDDLELRLDAAAGVIHVRSASRVGRSDLGANRRRVESIRARWSR